MNRDQSIVLIKSLICADDMFGDRKLQGDQDSKQCGLRTSAIPDHHGFVMIIFLINVEIVNTLVCTLECRLLNERFVSVFALM
jgi:hypothetical protein